MNIKDKILPRILHEVTETYGQLTAKFGMKNATIKKKEGENMPCIHYLSEIDRINIKKDLRPIIDDMAQNQVYMALNYILDGMEIGEAIDRANAIHKMRYR